MILIHAYKWFHHENVGNYYSSSESQFHNFAMYYGLPELSVKAAAWNLMNAGEWAATLAARHGQTYGPITVMCVLCMWTPPRAGVPGFIINMTRSDSVGAKREADINEQLKGQVFYWDAVHPDGPTGHKFMGEISAQVRRARTP